MENNQVYFYKWGQSKPKAIIILVHGLGEHIRRYDEQFEYLSNQGFITLAADLKGHGQSAGTRGVWNDINEQYEIISEVFKMAQTDYPQIPIFLYGHSMGGNIAIGYMIDRRPKVKGLIITGAAIKTPKDMPSFIVNALLSSPPLIQNIVIPNGLNLKSLCSDKKIIEEYKKDPLVHTKVSLAAGATILKNAQTILSYKLENDYPVLLMHGAKDTICYPKGTELLSREVFMNKVTIKIWGNMYHEIHNETDKKQVWDFMMDWMNKNVQ